DQLGLAHFLEHMAFNGTENFAKHEIIDYLESIGMKFGPEINAYTGFDETVYMLQLPTDSAEILEKGFHILEEWAHRISFEPEEIEKERGVVIEEWRLGRGAKMRMLDKQLPVIFRGSRYADRLPIGNMENLKTFQHETLKRFYRDWYRPELMAVIAVGDFDADSILELIGERFSDMPFNENTRAREAYPVPDHKETLFAIATDPEATSTNVSVYYKNDVSPESTVDDYRRMLIEQLFSRMLNIRLYELLNQAEPPYLYAYVLKNDLVRTKTIYSLNVAVREDGINKGLENILTEATRVQKHGFTQSELERTKTWMIRRMEQTYQERDKTESGNFTSEYLRNFLEAEPIPGIAFEYQAVKLLVPGISLDEINRMAGKWLADENRVVLLNAPDKEGLETPDELSLFSLFTSVEQKDIRPYEDVTSEEPLLEELTTSGDIVSETRIEELDVSVWELSNGITVILKPTDFKNDEIQFQGYSPGGNSLVENKQYRSAIAAADIVSLSGVGQFDLNALNKKRTGKVVTVFPYINELSEGVAGNASTHDLETLFQLVYLYMTRPRKDSTAYLSYKTRMQGFIENRFSSPEAAFNDTLQVTLANYHFRGRPWSMELLEEIDPEESYNIYLDRFSDVGDFTFIFVGSLDMDTIRPLVKTYLGSLPSSGRQESWQDVGVNPPEGVILKTVKRG
ncbi:insulinase family protein, partial [Bacteroidota bacterium]